ncbi:HNH endonuclease [Tissierella sp.]|uniref:HNH endonuclease n=1 Tax=Tissierella sp. TaxID=41274 RepID=UPI0028AAC498|nr:HNH endonuclease [Tissierella sp.]
MSEMDCVYCGKVITKRSKEHIVQNALGGLYESEEICCEKCNNFLSKNVDAPFTKIFNPIISRIDNFTKTNNKKSHPSCSGKAIYDNEIYDVVIKDGKVVSCIELGRKLKCDISKLKFEIVAYDFQIDNSSFKSGIGKIAFNFAMEKGIDYEILSKGISIKEKDGEVDSILFSFPIIPFVALNPMDDYIELNTRMELYHNLILFSQDSNLWCYVDLFNTFQYYVILSNEWDAKEPVLETYLQLLQQIDRTKPELYIRKPKHILAYAMFFNVEPCMNLEEFKKRVEVAVQKESLKKNMSDVLSAKLGYDYFNIDKIKDMKKEEARLYLRNEKGLSLKSLLLYFDEEDKFKDSTFRQVTCVGDKYKIVSYPLLINKLLKTGSIDVREYTYKKFERVNAFLAGIDRLNEGDDNDDKEQDEI